MRRSFLADELARACAFVCLVLQDHECNGPLWFCMFPNDWTKKRDSNVITRRSTQYRKRDCNAFRRRSTQFKIETAMCSEEDRPNTKQRLQCVQEKIDPMQNRSCHVFRTRSISFVNAVILRFQNLNTQMLSSIANVISGVTPAPNSLSPCSQCSSHSGSSTRMPLCYEL